MYGARFDMNVYDFDKTIFDGDAEDRFFRFIFQKKGFRHYWLVYWWNEFLLKCKLRTKTKTRRNEYQFLRKIEDIDAVLEEYWDLVEKHMMPWYSTARRDDDVIATGTPGFLMEPIIRRLGIKHMIATKMDKKTGEIDGLFAVGEPKAKAFLQVYPEGSIDNFYSDAWSDHFMAELAKKAWIVRGNGELTEWNEFFANHPKK